MMKPIRDDAWPWPDRCGEPALFLKESVPGFKNMERGHAFMDLDGFPVYNAVIFLIERGKTMLCIVSAPCEA